MNHTIAHLFSDHLVTALSRTLMHSLWQGALLSVLTGLIMTFTRKTSSALRYNLLVAALMLFALVVTGTLVMEFNRDASRALVAAGSYPADERSVPAGTTVDPAAASLSAIETIGAYLNRYAAVIVWIWLIVVCARCVQFTSGLNDLYQLRRKDLFRIDPYWEERLRQLGVKMGMQRWVGILESGRTKVPMVIGHLKPLILVPVGMLASLSAEEAEAILLHELAHIRRADYLVNLLQNLLEIVLFFNPPVLWLSWLIKAERENCCDDMALVHSGKVNYLKALVACEEYNQPSPVYAMSLKGSGGGLKKRVTRIIAGKNPPLDKREKSLLAVCLIAAGLFAMAFASGRNTVAFRAGSTKDARAKSDSVRTQQITGDMVNDGIITSPDGLSFKIGTDEFVVNYQKQPDAVYQRYRAKYVASQHSGSGDWIWYYHFDTPRWDLMVAHKYTMPENMAHPQTDNATTGVFQGKLN